VLAKQESKTRTRPMLFFIVYLVTQNHDTSTCTVSIVLVPVRDIQNDDFRCFLHQNVLRSILRSVLLFLHSNTFAVRFMGMAT
jgi:hypothetical protein